MSVKGYGREKKKKKRFDAINTPASDTRVLQFICVCAHKPKPNGPNANRAKAECDTHLFPKKVNGIALFVYASSPSTEMGIHIYSELASECDALCVALCVYGDHMVYLRMQQIDR